MLIYVLLLFLQFALLLVFHQSVGRCPFSSRDAASVRISYSGSLDDEAVEGLEAVRTTLRQNTA